MDKLWSATLNQHSDRYKTWHDVLGSDEIPLKGPTSHAAALGVPVQETAEVYELDIEKLTPQQHARLVTWCAKKFKCPEREVIDGIALEGFAVRAEDVVVAFSMRAFL